MTKFTKVMSKKLKESRLPRSPLYILCASNFYLLTYISHIAHLIAYLLFQKPENKAEHKSKKQNIHIKLCPPPQLNNLVCVRSAEIYFLFMSQDKLITTSISYTKSNQTTISLQSLYQRKCKAYDIVDHPHMAGVYPVE